MPDPKAPHTGDVFRRRVHRVMYIGFAILAVLLIYALIQHQNPY